ncbi:MAG: hypothetical protein K6G49_02040 [Candidatus Saccharibacteria bacterium]|nr:hypothetical protein [Candidatus Saccharibacteria bacterium]
MNSDILAFIIAPTITGIFAVMGNYMITSKKSKEQEIKEAKREQKIDDRLGRIEENQARQEAKIDEHNGYAKRFGEIEKSIVKIETKINR